MSWLDKNVFRRMIWPELHEAEYKKARQERPWRASGVGEKPEEVLIRYVCATHDEPFFVRYWRRHEEEAYAVAGYIVSSDSDESTDDAHGPEIVSDLISTGGFEARHNIVCPVCHTTPKPAFIKEGGKVVIRNGGGWMCGQCGEYHCMGRTDLLLVRCRKSCGRVHANFGVNLKTFNSVLPPPSSPLVSVINTSKGGDYARTEGNLYRKPLDGSRQQPSGKVSVPLDGVRLQCPADFHYRRPAGKR